MIAPKRRRLFFKFKGNILFNPNSHNLLGTDIHPRYRVEPKDLLEISTWSNSEKSQGYAFDPESGLFLKNIETTSQEALFDFSVMKTIPPFGFADRIGYAEYVSKTFGNEYQTSLKEKLEALPSPTDLTVFVFHYTLTSKKVVDENAKRFVKISYDS